MCHCVGRFTAPGLHDNAKIISNDMTVIALVWMNITCPRPSMVAAAILQHHNKSANDRGQPEELVLPTHILFGRYSIGHAILSYDARCGTRRIVCPLAIMRDGVACILYLTRWTCSRWILMDDVTKYLVGWYPWYEIHVEIDKMLSMWLPQMPRIQYHIDENWADNLMSI